MSFKGFRAEGGCEARKKKAPRWRCGKAEGCWQAGRPRGRKYAKEEKTKPLALAAARGFGAIVDSGLLSHMTLCSIIGDGELNFRVRNGIGCTLSSMAINEICQILIDRDGRIFFKHKPHGLLVLVSSTPRGASTSSLSTR